MYFRITTVRCLLVTQYRPPVLRSVAALGTKKYNSTSTATQTELESWERAKPYQDIPGPKPLPIIGNVWRFIAGDMHGMGVKEMSEYFHKKYGTIARLTGVPGRNDMVFLFDADDVEKVFRNEGPWPLRDVLQSLVYYRNVYRKDKFQGVGGLVTVQGEEWQKFRSKVNQTMMQPRSTKLYIAPIDAVANDFIERIRYLRDTKQEMPSDFNNEMYKWGLESIAYIALDTRLGCLSQFLDPNSEPQKIIDSMQLQLESMYPLEMKIPFWKIISTPAWRNLVKSSDYFLSVALKYINEAAERLKNMPEDRDRELTVLEKLLASDPDPRTAVVMALDMLGGGIDTTAHTAVIAMYYLAINQDKQQKLFEEIQRFLPNKNEPINSESLNQLKYLKACIKESMRMSPIVTANQRILVKDMVLSDYQVPTGTTIMFPFLLLSNMEKHFVEPDKFIPERWIKGDPQSNKKLHSFVTLPFGFGPRMCVGRRFAELEIETLLAKMIRNFRLEYNYGKMKFSSKLLYTPSSPLKFKMVDREN